MKTQFILIILLLVLSYAKAQFNTIKLTFTAIDNANYIQLDSIKIMNRTQGVDSILYWPDSVLVLNSNLDIVELNNAGESLQVFQNYPNPVADQTIISLYIPEKDKVEIMVTDLMGRVLSNSDIVLEKGTHYFRFTPGSGNLFFFIAQWRGMGCSIKILKTTNNSNGKSILEYLPNDISLKPLKAVKNIQEFPFSIGDELLYIGYANGFQSGLLDSPAENKILSFPIRCKHPMPRNTHSDI